MKNEINKNQELVIAYIGGGSRGWAWGFQKDLSLDPQIRGKVKLYDIDHDAAAKNKRIGELISVHPDCRSKWQYEVADTLKEALTGADFVVISILPGKFGHMRSDVHWPERYGVWQSVGDTVGPGGLLRSLRTVPMIAQFAQAIHDYAPNAWVINYTNPMSVSMLTLYEIFPEIHAFGCCHEIFSTQNLLIDMLDVMEGIHGLDRTDIKTSVTGINHFTWLYKASYQGQNLFPIYRKFVDKYLSTGFQKIEDENRMNREFACNHRVKFDLFRRYGWIAAAGDRHLAEFMPPWYLKDEKTVEQWGFGLTSVEWREKDLNERLEKQKAILEGSEYLEIHPSGEEGHVLLKALLGLGDVMSNVNLPNRGQVSSLPLGSIVETNAVFRLHEIAPLLTESIPKGLDALVIRHALNQINTVRAALDCDFQLALNVLLNDPQMALVSPMDAEEMFIQMLENTLDILPSKWKDRV